ncbi:hypothetical protein Tco_1176644 [Tanacetum coccineum]
MHKTVLVSQTSGRKSRRRGKVYNSEIATYGKIWDNEDVHDLGSVENEFPAIVFNDTLTSETTLSCEPTVSSLNNDEIDFRISFDESDDEDCTVLLMISEVELQALADLKSILFLKMILDVVFYGKIYEFVYLQFLLEVQRTQSYSPGPSTTLSYSAARPSTPPTYSSGPSRNADCSNCKLLIGKITALEETLEMYMHPENHTLDSTALLNDLYNDMDKFGLE